MSERDKKLLVVAIPLLIGAGVLIFLLVIKPMRGAPTTPTAEVQPTAVTATTSTGAAGGPQTATGTTATGAAGEGTEVAAVSWKGLPSREPTRSDPFVSYTKIQPGKLVCSDGRPGLPSLVAGTLPAVGAKAGGRPPDDKPPPDEHARRMAGVLHNGRVWAIYEIDGVSMVVKPGDAIGNEVVDEIGTEHLVLRSVEDGQKRKVPLERVSGSESGAGGYTPGVYTPGGGGTRPPGPLPPPAL
jgi:hypothetical protein